MTAKIESEKLKTRHDKWGGHVLLNASENSPFLSKVGVYDVEESSLKLDWIKNGSNWCVKYSIT